ncbi:MAG: ADP-forming succinate--CoA ligase subunit beta [Acidobacteria bacterium]|nr:MAG: ADP-forming succinate--CoA ligase subunit beta [Acidobacteriota bacterium]PYQ22985.1 MAG: ADP-forming succinate--CoA ligase subunit beta [Acidobacteriota bacterium]
MKLHEYQAKALLSSFGVPVPTGKVAYTAAEAVEVAKGLGFPVVVKAQIHAGGRGKGGGVKLARSGDETDAIAKGMLGMKLRTHQTGPEGRIVRRLLVEQGMDLAGSREMYLAIVVDRARQATVFMASAQGGMDIEEVAAKDPRAILMEAIEPAAGFQPFQARKLAFGLGLPPATLAKTVAFMQAIHRAFEALDASLVEINPFLMTKDGALLALDAKVNLDDNALYRHSELKELRDFDEEDPLEVEASKYSLNYIKLEGGDVGCMVNGAGLAMATMDIIKLAGGSPANFLDVGGGASAEQIRNAFRILLADPEVKAVLINIFGGILRCDVLAEGVIAAVRELGVKVPVVIRMKGNNEEKGKAMLRDSGLNFATADDMTEAAARVVAAAKGRR